MITIDFSDLRRGALFADSFDDVRLYDSQSFQVGENYYIEKRGTLLGTAKIEAIHCFPFSRLHESISQRLYGKHAAYMGAILKRMYETKEFSIQNDTRMMQLVFSWTEREIKNQMELLEKFWEEKKETYNKKPLKHTLFA